MLKFERYTNAELNVDLNFEPPQHSLLVMYEDIAEKIITKTPETYRRLEKVVKALALEEKTATIWSIDRKTLLPLHIGYVYKKEYKFDVYGATEKEFFVKGGFYEEATVK